VSRLAALIVLGLLRTGAAAAQEEPPPAQPAEPTPAPPSESPRYGTFEIGGGALTPTGSDVQTIYGSGVHSAAFHMRGSWLPFERFVDLGLSADLTQMNGERTGLAGGGQSAEGTELTLAPFAATAALRLEVFRDQPLVPYGGAGLAYLIWGERDTFTGANVSGDKYGWTAFGGASVLLDWIEPGRARDLDGWYGINHTYLNLELAETRYDRLGKGVVGLDLSHWEARAAFMFLF